MKKIALNILWFLVNKLDPLTVTAVTVGRSEVAFVFSKGFLRAGEWEHLAFTGSVWMKADANGELGHYRDITIYKNGETKYHQDMGRDKIILAH